jgi:hypothetical protein
MAAIVYRQSARFLRASAWPVCAAFLLAGCATPPPPLAATRDQIIISVRDQKLTVVKEDHTRLTFPISTSKFGLGDRRGTYATPTGELAVAAKIGAGKPAGTVFHGRVSTGEIVKIDAPGRDAIVSRILALRGLDANNRLAYSRGIYIHGTPEERNIRMRSKDVIQLFDLVNVGARVQIIDSTQNEAIASNILTPAPAGPTAPGTALAAAEAASSNSPPPPTATSASPAAATKPLAPAAVAAATPAGKKVWVGTPSQLLATQAANEARARKERKPPVGAPASARPVSNDSQSDAARALSRPATDSL